MDTQNQSQSLSFKTHKIIEYEHSNIQIGFFPNNGHNKSKLSSSSQFYGWYFVISKYLGTFEIDFWCHKAWVCYFTHDISQCNLHLKKWKNKGHKNCSVI